MFRAAEEAINILIAAQRDCEEMYIRDHEPVVRILPSSKANKDQPE